MKINLFTEIVGIAAICAVSALGQQVERPPVANAAALNLPARPIGPNELLTVTIYNQPQLCRTVRVSADGLIRLPMIRQRLNAAGLLPEELETAIAAAYQDGGILVDPEITVNIAEYHSHPIQVGGAVRRPVTFQAEAPITLLEAINRADGLSETAGPDILVTKAETGPNGLQPGITRRIAVRALFDGADQSVNLILTGGEEIKIPEAGRVFVVGNVKKPCQYLVREGESTVMQALAYSEGLLRYSTKQAYIYRREANGSKSEIPIELHKIMMRQSPDIPLLADDILYVPENEKTRMSMAALAAITGMGGGIASALVYTTVR